MTFKGAGSLFTISSVLETPSSRNPLMNTAGTGRISIGGTTFAERLRIVSAWLKRRNASAVASP